MKWTNLAQTYKSLLAENPNILSYEERKRIRGLFRKFISQDTNINLNQDYFTDKLEVIKIIVKDIGLGKSPILSVLFLELVNTNAISSNDIDTLFNTSISPIISGLQRINQLYEKNLALETENFRKLMLTMAEDVRVILLMVAMRLHTMRNLEKYSTEKQQEVARESAFLYAPLAHRMGLYKIKTELEDLSLKFTNREIYKGIAKKLNETKASRDRYIAAFIAPLKEKMMEIGYPFEIKGRTKSIHSIYSKMKKQNTAFENIYDLFAIRIIFDTPIKREKSVCWQAYSIVTDMYQPNPKRLRDWLSIPKSNGYESLHTTVLGSDNKWVEVQIRTERMNEVAEKGLAAHWKYKGIKSESGMDSWLKSIRDILENPELNAVDFMDEFKLDLYDKEVFVFTPNGDLFKLAKGATVLDFAFAIHTNLGVQCVGAKVNGKNVQIKHVLSNGDQVEILTSPTQHPNPSWLKIVASSKAKNKIRQSLKEIEYKDADLGREILVRRFKNWKIELDDGRLSRLSKKNGYRTVSDFYQDVAQEKIDMLEIRDTYLELLKRDESNEFETKTAESFVQDDKFIQERFKEDVLVIGNHLKNVDYKLSKCCNPVYGDKIFGFVSVTGGIKIHRTNCPNAPQMIARFGYRIIKATWSGKSEGNKYPITLRVVGNDDIGIVTNITSLINKESKVLLRSISVDSSAGLFEGNLTIMVDNNKDLEEMIKKIRNVRGVKNVTRE